MNDQDQRTTGEIQLVYVGTYTDLGSQGIYICQLDMTTGKLRRVGVARNVDNPSYLAIDARRFRLYAVNERVEYDRQPGGRVSAFAIDTNSGELSFINQQSSHGGAPCYLALNHTGRYLFVANYMGGNVAVIPVGEDGALGQPTDVVAHSGGGHLPARQEGPHPHAVVLDSQNDYVFVPDLGLDKVLQYRLERDTGQLAANQEPWTKAPSGSGPRHMVFHRNMGLAYVINELSSSVTAYAYDAARGTLAPFQTISTLPEAYSGTNIAADLHLAPNGRFLYGSNRGHDSIAIYAVHQATGSLTHLDFVSTQGRTPRGFAIEPTGNYLLVANQDSNNVVTFRIDNYLGTIIPTGHSLDILTPVCLKFLAITAS